MDVAKAIGEDISQLVTQIKGNHTTGVGSRDKRYSTQPAHMGSEHRSRMGCAHPQPQGDERSPGLAEWMLRRRSSARMPRTLSEPQDEGNSLAGERDAHT